MAGTWIWSTPPGRSRDCASARAATSGRLAWVSLRSRSPARRGRCRAPTPWHGSAYSPKDTGDLVAAHRPHRLGANVAEGGGLQQQPQSDLIVGRFDHGDDVVFAEGPQELADLATSLADHVAEALRPRHGVAIVLDALIGPAHEGDVRGHAAAPFPRT